MIGVFEEEIGGEKVCLRFGVLCMDYFEKAEGEDFAGAMMKLGRYTMSSINLLYCAAKDYAETNGIEFKVTRQDAIRWFESDKSRCNEIMAEGLTQYTPKNSKSPQETGSPSQ
jgi:hypothetical protein